MRFFILALGLALAAQARPAAKPRPAAASIRGVIKFSGQPPERKKLATPADTACGKAAIFDDAVVLSADQKRLGNVVVRLLGAPATPASSKPVVLQQTGCSYQPRVSCAVVGQTIEIRNGDKTTHNVRAVSSTSKLSLFNRAQPPGAAAIAKPAPPDASILEFKCDMHPWMTAFVAVAANASCAVSDADGGFEIKNAPAGTYTLEAWHETFGTRTASVTVEEGKQTSVELEFGPPR